MKRPWTYSILSLIASAVFTDAKFLPKPFQSLVNGTAISSSPTANPGNETVSPAPSLPPSGNSSTTPTTSPGNVTVSPTPLISPTPTMNPTHGNVTASPTPTIAPTKSNKTVSPAPSIAPTTSNVTTKPTASPTTAVPTVTPTEEPNHHNRHFQFWNVLYKTIAWMIVAGLAVLAFGSCMSNRYRIYYYLRGLWFSFLRLDCTASVLRTLRLDGLVYGRWGAGGGGRDSSLNDIIFESNDLQEGLLMRETIG